MPHPVDIYVGQQIRKARILRGLNQTQLGDPLDISFQQVQKCEKGTNRVAASRLLMLSSILSLPVSYFFDGADGVDVEEAKVSKSALKLAREIEAIKDQKAKKKFLDLMAHFYG